MRKIIGIGCVLLGLFVFLYPDLATRMEKEETKTYMKEFKEENKDAEKETDARMEAVETYNQAIAANEQESFQDAWTCTQSPISLEGFEDERFGYLRIPAMEEELPLYLGASKKNMARGTAILGGTSLPIGGESTNCVIAGHRGYKGIPYFREIEKLKPGDKVYVQNPWEELTYVVESIRIIHPYDVDAVKIQPGRDMLSLMTCHPYRSHGKNRYVVYCVRDEGQEIKAEPLPVFDSSKDDIQRERIFRMICGTLILVMSFFTIKSGKKRNNKKRV